MLLDSSPRSGTPLPWSHYCRPLATHSLIHSVSSQGWHGKSAVHGTTTTCDVRTYLFLLHVATLDDSFPLLGCLARRRAPARRCRPALPCRTDAPQSSASEATMPADPSCPTSSSSSARSSSPPTAAHQAAEAGHHVRPLACLHGALPVQLTRTAGTREIEVVVPCPDALMCHAHQAADDGVPVWILSRSTAARFLCFARTRRPRPFWAYVHGVSFCLDGWTCSGVVCGHAWSTAMPRRVIEWSSGAAV
jgi:hypothetical protein